MKKFQGRNPSVFPRPKNIYRKHFSFLTPIPGNKQPSKLPSTLQNSFKVNQSKENENNMIKLTLENNSNMNLNSNINKNQIQSQNVNEVEEVKIVDKLNDMPKNMSNDKTATESGNSSIQSNQTKDNKSLSGKKSRFKFVENISNNEKNQIIFPKEINSIIDKIFESKTMDEQLVCETKIFDLNDNTNEKEIHKEMDSLGLKTNNKTNSKTKEKKQIIPLQKINVH